MKLYEKIDWQWHKSHRPFTQDGGARSIPDNSWDMEITNDKRWRWLWVPNLGKEWQHFLFRD